MNIQDHAAHLMLVTLCSFSVLAGCAAPPVPLNRNEVSPIRKIVIVGPTEPTTYTAISGNAVLAMGVLSGLGGIAGASASASMLEAAVKKGDFDAEMKIVNPTFGADIRSALSEALRKDGYSVTEQVLPHGFSNWPSYDAISNDNDAVFDVSVLALYETDALSSVYTPTVGLEAQLVDKRTGKVLYRNGYNYGGHSKTNLSDPTYSFGSYKELISNPQRAAEYFRAAIPILVTAFARDLQK